jgi:hypothetical protein
MRQWRQTNVLGFGPKLTAWFDSAEGKARLQEAFALLERLYQECAKHEGPQFTREAFGILIRLAFAEQDGLFNHQGRPKTV